MSTTNLHSGIRLEHLAILAGHEPRLATSLPGRDQLHASAEEYIRKATAPGVKRRGNAAILRLDGPLMCETDWLYEWGYCLTHEALAETLMSLEADRSVATVVLDMHCAGWGVSGSSQTKEALARFKASGKRLIAYGRDLIASGGVYMATYCSEVSLSPTAMMGSIGTLILGYDTSAAYAENGIRPVVIASDADKAVGYPGVAYTQTAIANLQRMVDVDSAEFFAAVAAARGISVEDIRAMKAGIFGAGDALALKLADRIESPEEFFSRIAALPPAGSSRSGARFPSNTSTGGNRQEKRMEIEFEKLTAADLRAKCGALIGEIEKSAADAAVKAEQARAAAPATYGQLKEAFPGDAAFIVDCQDKGLSLGECHKAYAAKIRTELAAATARIGELEKAGQKKTEGEEPLTAGGAAPAQTGKHPFHAAALALAAEKKIPLHQAIGQLAASDPKGYREFVAAGQKKA